MGFSQALSGLNAAATNLDVIGNNIANSQTVGFKGARALFSDVFAGAKAGLGTRVAAVLQDFSTGTLEGTSRNLDLAVDGEGFFRLIQNDQVVYSRNGQLTLNNDGYLVNAQGARLTGYPPGVRAGGNPVELRIPAGALQAQPSTAIEAILNLDSRVDAIDRTGPPAIPFNPNDADSYSYANNVTLFDSQGNAHNTTMYFTKIAANQWEVQLATLDATGATLVAQNGGGTPQVGTITFDTNGVITGTTNMTGFRFPVGGGVADIEFDMDIGDTTQFGKDFELSRVGQDGFASGSLVGIAIDDKGNIVGSYSNEQTQNLGTIALVTFANMEGLSPVGDNAWVETTESGQALLGFAGSGQFGSIQAGVVENSNVDLTRELVNLIIAQRNYQANAQTIKVQDEVLQNAVNLR